MAFDAGLVPSLRQSGFVDTRLSGDFITFDMAAHQYINTAWFIVRRGFSAKDDAVINEL